MSSNAAYSLLIRPSLWRTALLKLQFPLVALYKCYAFTFTFYKGPNKVVGGQNGMSEWQPHSTEKNTEHSSCGQCHEWD